MHLSMHNWMRAEPIEVTIRRLAKYGYESIEISGEPEKDDTKEVRQLLDAYGLRCWGSVTLMFAGLNFPSADEATRERTLKYVKDCITMVKELEGEVMTIVPGTVGKVNADSTPEKEWAWAVDGLKEVYAYGQQAGVRLALEPLNRFETDLINVVEQGLALCEAVGSPHVGLHLDTFHMHLEERDSAAAIRRAGDRLFHFHACENDRGVPGRGQVEWGAVADALFDIEYDGAVVIESFTPEVKSIARAVCIWRDIAPNQDTIAAEGLAFLRELRLRYE